MSSILYILITTGFAFLIRIQQCYFHWNWVGIDEDTPWILKINQIHQNIPHLEYFQKRQHHPKCTAAIKVAAVQFANRRTRCGPRTGPGSVLNPGPVRLGPVQAGPWFRLIMNFTNRLNQVWTRTKPKLFYILSSRIRSFKFLKF